MPRSFFCIVILIASAAMFLFSCAQDGGEPGGTPPDPGENGKSGPSEIDLRDRLEDLLSRMDFDQYLDVHHTRVEQGANGYTNYYFSTDDCRCFEGGEAHVSVSFGATDNVMLFLEGGGAKWPGGGFAVSLDFPFDISFKSRKPGNPLADWHFVYVPYCDASVHSGDTVLEYSGKTRYHWGLRHTAAAVALMTELFPDPGKILVAGSSAGGFGTFYGWAVAKYAYLDTDTYVLNDSGVGFWNPDDPATWETIRQAWDLRIPEECARCDGPIQTYVYELFLEYDPQVRIGMFTSYGDWIISLMFLGMGQERFTATLLSVTDEIHRACPDRFNRFFVAGSTHTSYEFLFPQGPEYRVNGISMYEWIGQLVNDDPAWPDLLE